MEKEMQNIFLEDYSIRPWNAPPKKGYRDMSYIYNGSTELIKPIGFDSIDEVIGPFRIIGSAAKYLADIIHLDKKKPYKVNETVSGDIRHEILFDGGITIYREGQIPGTELYGYYPERQGRIWIAGDREEIFLNSDGLRNIIFEDSSDDIERIEAILNGYQAIEYEKDCNQMLRIPRSM